VYTWNKLQW